MQEEMDTMKIVIPRALKKQFKALCLELDTTMSEVVTELVEQWTEENKVSTKAE